MDAFRTGPSQTRQHRTATVVTLIVIVTAIYLRKFIKRPIYPPFSLAANFQNIHQTNKPFRTNKNEVKNDFTKPFRTNKNEVKKRRGHA